MGKFLLAALWKLGSSAFATVERVGGKVVGAAEKVADKLRPGAALPPAVAGTAKVVTGVTVVGAGVGGVVGGVTEGTEGAVRDSALATATEYVPGLVPEQYKVHDNKPFMQRFGEGFLPGFANGAISGATWIPVTLWNVGSGAWNYVTGNTTKDKMGKTADPKAAGQTGDISKETKPMADTATPPAVTAPSSADPAATEAAKKAAAEKAGQEQAAKAAELDAAKKKAEAAKQTEAEKLARQKAANDAEFEKAKKERAEELAREGKEGSFAKEFSKIAGDAGDGAKDLFDKINIWDGIRKLTEWVNQPGVPKLFRQFWNWGVGMLNTDAGRSIMLGLGALKGIGTGLGLAKDIITGKASKESLATDAFELGIAGALVGAGVQRPTGAPAANEDTYEDGNRSHGRRHRYDRQPPRDDRGYGDEDQPRVYQVEAGRNGRPLDENTTSAPAFRQASGPGAEGTARPPVYAYGTTPGNNGQKGLSGDFNKGGAPVVTGVVPPVQTVQGPRPNANDWDYRIDGSA